MTDNYMESDKRIVIVLTIFAFIIGFIIGSYLQYLSDKDYLNTTHYKTCHMEQTVEGTNICVE